MQSCPSPASKWNSSRVCYDIFMARLGKHFHYMKYKVCVSGAADEKHCPASALEDAREIGREIVRRNGVVITGATIGVPLWAAKGAKEEGGISIGFSPASSELAHTKTYRLPTEYFDIIVYTGFGYSGRNLFLTRASDAVITICGRMGTLNEFTVAFEDKKPQGVLVGSGGTADILEELVKNAGRGPGKIVYERDPHLLVEKVLNLVDREKVVPLQRRGKRRKK